MSNEKNKWIDAVGKLINLTQERKLIWMSAHELDDDNRPREFYETSYAGKTLKLRGYRNLYLVDPESGVEWVFPSSEAISHLEEAVKYQLVGVGDFLDELLAV
jgi:hypothetical protein